MKFSLKIKMGNAAMKTNMDVYLALRETADKLLREELKVPNGSIADINGNVVGEWKFSK